MRSIVALALSWCLSSLPVVGGAASVCALCGVPGVYPTNMDLVVADGRTCLDVYIDLTPMNPNSQQCRNQQNLYKDKCCSGSVGGGSGGNNGNRAGSSCYRGPTGNEPECPICGTYEYPGKPNEYIQARYVGEYSCGQFYDRGLHGLIPNFMCGPLQNFALDVCGCGRSNPACKADSSQCWNPGTPRQDNCGQAPRPNPSPVRAPNPSPVSMPVTDTKPTALGDRKVRSPGGGKTGARMAGGGRGGAAGTLRYSNRLLKGDQVSDVKETEYSLLG